jgi:hypothetical protein
MQTVSLAFVQESPVRLFAPVDESDDASPTSQADIHVETPRSAKSTASKRHKSPEQKQREQIHANPPGDGVSHRRNAFDGPGANGH